MSASYPPLRLHFLDSLRGLAAVYVILFHVLYVPTHPLKVSLPVEKVMGFGGTGVWLFFVISGFSLAMTMSRHEATGRPILSYGISRFFRIAPLFYCVLAYMIVRASWHGWFISRKEIALNLSFLFNLVPGRQEGIVPASWTIGVEMLFYAVFPLLHRARLRTQVIVAAGSQALFAALLFVLPKGYTTWTVIGWMPMFLIGMWAFRAHGSLAASGEAGRRVGSYLIAGSLAVLAVCALPHDASHQLLSRVPAAAAYAGLLLGLSVQPAGTFSWPILRLLGRLSYSTYLVHALFVVALLGPLGRATQGVPPDLAYACQAFAVLAAVVPTAWITQRFIERPADDAGRALIRWLTLRASASSPQVARRVN